MTDYLIAFGHLKWCKISSILALNRTMTCFFIYNNTSQFYRMQNRLILTMYFYIVWNGCIMLLYNTCTVYAAVPLIINTKKGGYYTFSGIIMHLVDYYTDPRGRVNPMSKTCF